ncbi:MAG: hypothetical protein HY399_08060 [Elusimicrobia bacterium]|nr:hypothetical protein [Elusimicrobiota bacterium]
MLSLFPVGFYGRIVRVFLSFSFLFLSPGIGFYEAVGQRFKPGEGKFQPSVSPVQNVPARSPSVGDLSLTRGAAYVPLNTASSYSISSSLVRPGVGSSSFHRTHFFVLPAPIVVPQVSPPARKGAPNASDVAASEQSPPESEDSEKIEREKKAMHRAGSMAKELLRGLSLEHGVEVSFPADMDLASMPGKAKKNENSSSGVSGSTLEQAPPATPVPPLDKKVLENPPPDPLKAKVTTFYQLVAAMLVLGWASVGAFTGWHNLTNPSFLKSPLLWIWVLISSLKYVPFLISYGLTGLRTAGALGQYFKSQGEKAGFRAIFFSPIAGQGFRHPAFENLPERTKKFIEVYIHRYEQGFNGSRIWSRVLNLLPQTLQRISQSAFMRWFWAVPWQALAAFPHLWHEFVAFLRAIRDTVVSYSRSVLFRNSALRTAFFSYVILAFLNPVIYSLVAPAFGLLASGGVATAGSNYQAWMTGLYSLGGLMGGVLLFREGKLIQEASRPPPKEGSASPVPERPFFNRSVKLFLWAGIIMQIGIEAVGLALPMLIKLKFAKYMVITQMAMYAALAGIVGSVVGGFLVKRLGPKAIVVSTTILSLINFSLLVYLLATGHMTLMVMMILEALGGFLGGVCGVAMGIIPLKFFGKNQAAMDRFYGIQQFSVEPVGIAGPPLASRIVGAFGFVVALIFYPVALLIGILLYFRMQVPKTDAEQTGGLGVHQQAISALSQAKNRLTEGFRWMISFVDRMILRLWLGRWMEEVKEDGQITEKGRNEISARSMLLWVKLGTLSFLFFVPMLLPLFHMKGLLAFIPIYLAMIPFGFLQVVGNRKLLSFIASQISSESREKEMSIFGALATAFSMALLMGIGFIFDHSNGLWPFVWFNLSLLPVAALFFWLTRLLSRYTRPNTL